jgi:ketosteroid isomerase-like protein
VPAEAGTHIDKLCCIKRKVVPMKRASLAAMTALLLFCAVPLFAAGSLEDDLRAALTAYREALVKKDLTKLETIWTDDYMFIDGHGRVRTKADRLADLRSSKTSLDKIQNEGAARVRVHGDVGIISSDVTLTGRYGGKEVSGLFRSTHIWVNKDGRWQLLMNQLTAVGE